MRSRGLKLHKDLVDTYGGMIEDIDRRMKLGEQVPGCLAKSLIMSKEEENLDAKDMAILASAFMIGGVETVRVAARDPGIPLIIPRPRPSCSGFLP